MGEKIRRKALLILSCVLMLEAVGIRHVPNFQRVGLILYAAGMLAMYAMTLRRKIKGLAVNENDFMPFLFGAGLLAIEVRRYDFGEEGKLWLWIIIISLLLALPMLLAAEKQVPDERADDEKYWGRAVILALVVLLSAHSWACLSNAAFDQSAGSAQTAYITEKWREKHKFSWDYHLRVAASGETESLTFQIGAGSYNRVSEGDNVTVTEHSGFWGAPYYTWEIPQSH